MRPEGPAHPMESESFSAAPSALSWEMARNPGLTAGPTHCQPFGPDRRSLPIVGQPLTRGATLVAALRASSYARGLVPAPKARHSGCPGRQGRGFSRTRCMGAPEHRRCGTTAWVKYRCLVFET